MCRLFQPYRETGIDDVVLEVATFKYVGIEYQSMKKKTETFRNKNLVPCVL